MAFFLLSTTVAITRAGFVDSALSTVAGCEGSGALLIGSSVARGRDALPLSSSGWSSLLADELCARYGLRLVNEAVDSATVATTRGRVDALLQRHHPHTVVIGLSTGNEGLSRAATASVAEAIAEQYESDLMALAHHVAAFPSVSLVVLGGVYPSDQNQPHHLHALRSLNARLLASAFPVIDFLRATDDGHGHWRANENSDGTHPNTLGHLIMFEAINVSIFKRQEAPRGAPSQSSTRADDGRGTRGKEQALQPQVSPGV